MLAFISWSYDIPEQSSHAMKLQDFAQFCCALASPQTSFGVRLSRIHFSPTGYNISPVGEKWMRDKRTPKDVGGEASCAFHLAWCFMYEADIGRFIFSHFLWLQVTWTYGILAISTPLTYFETEGGCVRVSFFLWETTWESQSQREET